MIRWLRRKSDNGTHRRRRLEQGRRHDGEHDVRIELEPHHAREGAHPDSHDRQRQP